MYRSAKYIPNHLKLIKSGDIWDTFYVTNYYVKILHESYINIYSSKKFLQVLGLLHNEKYQIMGIPKIFEIYLDDEALIGYSVYEKKGVPVKTYLQQSNHPWEEFLLFAKNFIAIIMAGNEKNIVFKDMAFHDNVLYDRESKEASILDIDSFQINGVSDKYIHKKILSSSIKEIILNPEGKYMENCHFTTELNFLLFYEIFFQAIFDKSILIWSTSSNFQEYLKEIMKEINLPKSSNLYFRIMDLSNVNCENTFAIEDFLEIQNNYHFDVQRKRIQ